MQQQEQGKDNDAAGEEGTDKKQGANPPKSLSRHSLPSQAVKNLGRLLFERDNLRVKRRKRGPSLSFPRFHFLGILWAAIELGIFLLALAKTDYSFQSLDTAGEVLESRHKQQAMLGKEEETGSGATGGVGHVNEEESMEEQGQTSLLIITSGAFSSLSSDYCGPEPGSPYFIYINRQALMAIEERQSAAMMAIDGTLLPQRDKEDTSEPSDAALQLWEMRGKVDGELLDLLFCRRSQPIFDERYVLSALSQSCSKGAGNLSTLTVQELDVCANPQNYGALLEVSGVTSVCLYTYALRPSDRATTGATVLCIQFGAIDMEREDFQWLFRRLEVAWEAIWSSAIIWIVLSIAMRLTYWLTVFQVARASLWHLRHDCPSSSLSSVPNLHPHETNLPPSSSPTDQSLPERKPSLSVVQVPRAAVDETLPRKAASQRKRVGGWLATSLTALSLGIACANNDTAYLVLAVLRQVFGAVYGEVLVASAVTTPLAGWQAFSIVVYHQAVIQLSFRGARRLFYSPRERLVPAILDVGMLGYVSLLFLCLATQSVQMVNFDIFCLFGATNTLITCLWWIILPNCEPDGPCLYIRGDIVLHSAAALYTASATLLLQLLLAFCLFAWDNRKKKGRRGFFCLGIYDEKVEALEDARSSAVGPHKDKMEVETCKATHQWLYLGTVGCPHCLAFIIKRPTFIQQNDGLPAVAEAKGKDGTRATEDVSTEMVDKRLKESNRCCLWTMCSHDCSRAAVTRESLEAGKRVNNYRFLAMTGGSWGLPRIKRSYLLFW